MVSLEIRFSPFSSICFLLLLIVEAVVFYLFQTWLNCLYKDFLLYVCSVKSHAQLMIWQHCFPSTVQKPFTLRLYRQARRWRHPLLTAELRSVWSSLRWMSKASLGIHQHGLCWGISALSAVPPHRAVSECPRFPGSLTPAALPGPTCSVVRRRSHCLPQVSVGLYFQFLCSIYRQCPVIFLPVLHIMQIKR